MGGPAEEALTGREVEVLELGVDDRTAAVVVALERGIIALPRRR